MSIDSSPSSLDLLRYRRNVHSHNGEDGVLEHLLSRLPGNGRWAVEFGAWDGRHASNTCHLLESHGWNVVFIEGDDRKFRDLRGHHGACTRAHLLHKWIALDGADTLDGLLSMVPGCPRDLDFMSMDIDGCEYHLWEGLKQFRPKIVMVEFNPSIPLDYEYVQPRDFSVQHSSSLSAFVYLGRRLGYTLLSVLDYNAIFVRTELVEFLGYAPADPVALFAPFRERYQTQVWQSMDGRLHLVGCKRLIWHNLEIRESRLQVLPRWMQITTGGNGTLKSVLSFFYSHIPFVPQLLNLLVSGRWTLPKPAPETSSER